MWIDFIQIDPFKNLLKKQRSQFEVLRNPLNKLYAMVTPWEKKCYLEIHWNQFHYWKPQKIFLFKRNPPKRTSFTEKPQKLISPKENSKKSTPTTRIQRKLFSRLENRKKEFSFFCKILRTKYVDGKIMQQVCFENSPGNQFHGKNPWKLFWFKKFHGNQFRWFQKDQIEFANEKFPEVRSPKIDSMKTAFVIGETRTNTISLTGTPDEPISYKCNARKLVFLEENPPISSIGNTRKILSMTKMCWKSISSGKNLIHNLPWKNAHGKTSVDRFSL